MDPERDYAKRWTTDDGEIIRRRVVLAIEQQSYRTLDDLRGKDVGFFDIEDGSWDLRGIDLRDMILPEKVEFGGALLDGAKFDGSTLKRTQFQFASLQRTSFRGCELQKVMFSNADARGTSFNGARLVSCDFQMARLDGASFQDTKLQDPDFGNADLSDAVFAHSTVDGAVWSRAIVERARLPKSLWQEIVRDTEEAMWWTLERLDVTGLPTSEQEMIADVLHDAGYRELRLWRWGPRQVIRSKPPEHSSEG